MNFSLCLFYAKAPRVSQLNKVTQNKMAALKLRQALLLRKSCVGGLFQASRTASNMPAPWNYIWMPGPYPKTEEERLAAAKKYGMIPEDYRPFPDDGYGLGDYPDLGHFSGNSRSGQLWWDDEDDKRNFGAPVQYDFFYTKDVGVDTEAHKYPLPPEYAFLATLAWVGGFFFMFWILSNYPVFGPVSEKQLPTLEKNKGRKWYTFEKPE